MQPKEIADSIKERLKSVANKKSFYVTISNNLKTDFAINYIKYSTLNYDEWMYLKNAINDIIDDNVAALQKEKLKELEKEQEAINKRIQDIKENLNKR